MTQGLRHALTAFAGAALAWGCTSFNLDQGRGYPCAPDGSSDQCAAGWVCGLEGLCHDSDAGGPFQCASANPCTGGWQCGLEGVCHDPDAGAPYLCATIQGNVVSKPSDTWCASGWLCAKSGRCTLPAAGEGKIASLPPDASIQVDPISPLALWEQPASVAFSDQLVAVKIFQNAAFVDRGELTILQRTTEKLSLGSATEDSYALIQVPFTGTASATAATGAYIYVQTYAGLFSFLADGGPGETHPEVMAAQLRQARPTGDVYGSQVIVAFDAGTLWTLFEDGDGGLVVTSGSLADGGAILQVSGDPNGSCTDWAALDESGALYRATSNGQVFSPWARADWGLDPDAGQVAQNLQLRSGQLAASFTDGAGNTSVGLWGISSNCNPTAPLNPINPLCAACFGAVGELHSFSQRDGTPWVEARCLLGQGPVQVGTDPFSGQCLTVQTPPNAEATLFDDLLPAQALAGLAGYAGSHGQLLFGATLATADAFTLDQIPSALMGHDVKLLASANATSYIWTPGLGALRTRTALSPSETLVSAVDGAPYWGIFADGTAKVVLDSDDDINDGDADSLLPWTFAGLDSTIAQFQPPFSAAARDSGGGGTLVVVAAGDVLLGTDMVDVNAPSPSVLQVKAVPAPGSPITSLALLPGTADASGGLSVSGYVLAQGSVYAFQGPSDGPLWSSALIDTGVPVEDAPGEASNNLVSAPLKVFAADSTAWLGLQDGAVYSLPHLIQAAPAFLQQGLLEPGNGQSWAAAAIDYGQACGVTYVATVYGAYRLQPPAPGQRLGFWVPETGFKGGLAPRDPTLNSFTGLNPSRFYGALDELYWVSAFGSIARLKVLGCPP